MGREFRISDFGLRKADFGSKETGVRRQREAVGGWRNAALEVGGKW
jgi:hypothetical protein